MTEGKLSGPKSAPVKKKAKTLRGGEALNPDNLRYIDSQGMNQDDAGGGYWASEFKAFMQAQTLKALFFSDDWVYITVDCIAAPISRLMPKVFQTTRTESGEDKRDALNDHPITKLMKRPNPYQTSQELMYSFACDLVLGGNGFLYQKQGSNSIANLPFERVQYNFDQQGIPNFLMFYPQQQDDTVTLDVKNMQMPLSDIIHTKKASPSSAFWGLSPFTPGRKGVLVNRYTTDYILAFYLKGATPQMILEVDQMAGQKALVRMLRSFEAAYTGRRNQRRTLLLPKGVKATIADTKIVDQQFMDLVNQNRETILNLLHIPKHAVGLAEAGSLGSREHEMAMRYFWDSTIVPTMELIEKSLTEHFFKRGMLLEGQEIAFDTTSVPYAQEDLLKSAEISDKLAGTWTVNERRARLFGLPAIPDGDVIATLQKPPLSFQLPSGPTPAPQLPEAPTPPVVSMEPVQEAERVPEHVMGTENTIQTDVPLASTETKEPWHARVISRHAEGLRSTSKVMEDEATKQLDEMTRLSTRLLMEHAIAGVSAFKKAVRMRGKRAELNKKEFDKNMKKSIDDFEKGYLDDYTKTLYSTMNAGYGAQVGLIFDNKSKEALASYQETDVEGQRKILRARGLFQFESVKQTSTDRVAQRVENGLKAGKSVSEISDSIVDDMKGEARWRANTIARTETLTAFSIGGMATLERAKQAIPELKKMWVNSADDHVRADHIAMQGQTVGADEDFELPDGSKGTFPRAPGLTAGQAINCFVGSTDFNATGVRASYRREYDGSVITINTRSGRHLTGTPNHPVLTSIGWKALGDLNKGDYLVCADIHVSGLTTENMNQIKSTAEEIHASLKKSWISEGQSGSALDFHGDGSDKQVDIVSAHGLLKAHSETATGQDASNLRFPSTNFASSFGTTDSALNKDGLSLLSSGRSHVSGSELPLSLSSAHQLPLNSLSVGLAPSLNTGFDEPLQNNVPRDSQVFGDTVLAPEFYCVQMDEIVDVQLNNTKTHVYTLSTSSEQYIANGIVVHNCRCVCLMLPPEDVADYAEEVEALSDKPVTVE